jgi:hypothetical protein
MMCRVKSRSEVALHRVQRFVGAILHVTPPRMYTLIGVAGPDGGERRTIEPIPPDRARPSNRERVPRHLSSTSENRNIEQSPPARGVR